VIALGVLTTALAITLIHYRAKIRDWLRKPPNRLRKLRGRLSKGLPGAGSWLRGAFITARHRSAQQLGWAAGSGPTRLGTRLRTRLWARLGPGRALGLLGGAGVLVAAVAGVRVAALGAGVVVGMVTGVFGAGGALVAIPTLSYVFGQSAGHASTGSLVIVGATALINVLHGLVTKDTHLDWRTGLILGAAGFAPAIAAGLLATHISPYGPQIGLAVLMGLAAIKMWLGGRQEATGTTTGVTRLVRTAAIGMFAGFLTGLLGIGGAFLIIPALVLAKVTNPKTATASVVMVTAINSLARLAGRISTLPTLDWSLIAPFAATAVLAGLLGKQISKKLSANNLQRGFAVFLIALAGYTSYQALSALTGDLVTAGSGAALLTAALTAALAGAGPRAVKWLTGRARMANKPAGERAKLDTAIADALARLAEVPGFNRTADHSLLRTELNRVRTLLGELGDPLLPADLDRLHQLADQAQQAITRLRRLLAAPKHGPPHAFAVTRTGAPAEPGQPEQAVLAELRDEGPVTAAESEELGVASPTGKWPALGMSLRLVEGLHERLAEAGSEMLVIYLLDPDTKEVFADRAFFEDWVRPLSEPTRRFTEDHELAHATHPNPHHRELDIWHSYPPPVRRELASLAHRVLDHQPAALRGYRRGPPPPRTTPARGAARTAQGARRMRGSIRER
jgi:hypothetical protein